MPLPQSDAQTPWPPRDHAAQASDQRSWAAWWTGDTTALADTTQAAAGRRSFWGRAKTDTTTATKRMTAGLAGDIAATSADLLFGEPPSLLVPDIGLARAHERAKPGAQLAPWTSPDFTTADVVAAQDRLDELVDTLGVANRLLEGGELCAALGSVYLRPVWDSNVANHPLLTVVRADQAVPDLAFGMLRAVTFTEVVEEDTSQTWRHLERHEPGVILHGLYVGTKTSLGRQVALSDHPKTSGLQPIVEVDPEITGGRPGIMPRRVINAPARRTGRTVRADIDGVEDRLDALDETWSSWMRDLRLGQARLVVPDEFLTPVGARPGNERTFSGFGTRGGPGAARGFDLDSELITGLNIPDLKELGGAEAIKPVQFAIRLTEHEGTAMALTESIVQSCGYSPQTFGLHIEGRAESGTALRIREGKTWRTQGRKQRYWAPEVSAVTQTLLALDQVIFGRPTPIVRPAVGWQELADDPQGTAQWVTSLAGAQAASIETRVRLTQPQLDDDQIADEVARIKQESGVGVPDPTPGLELP